MVLHTDPDWGGRCSCRSRATSGSTSPARADPASTPCSTTGRRRSSTPSPRTSTSPSTTTSRSTSGRSRTSSTRSAASPCTSRPPPRTTNPTSASRSRVASGRRPDRARVRTLAAPPAAQPRHPQVGGPDEIPDLGRIGRQQAFLREVGTRAMDTALSDPFKANEIADKRSRTSPSTRTSVAVTSSPSPTASPVARTGSAGPRARRSRPSRRRTTARMCSNPRATPTRSCRGLRDFELHRPRPRRRRARGCQRQGVERLGEGRRGGRGARHAEAERVRGSRLDNSAQPYQASEVRYAPAEAAARSVASFVTGPVQIVEKGSIPGGDVTLYIGRAFTGIGAAAVPVSLTPVPGGC